jgi:hypothetical protein
VAHADRAAKAADVFELVFEVRDAADGLHDVDLAAFASMAMPAES